MAYNIGINVIETEGRTSPAIAGAPTSVAGFIVCSARGSTEGAPVRVSSFRQFTDRFGGYHDDYVSAYCVDGFFANGGQVAYIARIVNDGAKAASVTLKDIDGYDGTLTVTAGYRGKPEVGAWGNSLYLDIRSNPVFSTVLKASLEGLQPARLRGKKITSPVDLSPFTGYLPRTLVFKIDNDNNKIITIKFGKEQLLVPSQSPIDDIVNAINSQANEHIVAFNKNNQIEIVSKIKGDSSKIELSDSSYQETIRQLGLDDLSIGKGVANTPATLTGKKIDEPVSTQDGDTLTLSINGTKHTINFHEMPSLTEIVSAINADEKIKELLEPVTLSGGLLVFKTIKNGKDASIEVCYDDTLTLLKFDPAEKTATSTSSAISNERIQVQSISGLQTANWICLDDGITQDWLKIKSFTTDTDTNTGETCNFIELEAVVEREYTKEETRLYTGEFDLVIQTKNATGLQVIETLERLQLDPASPNYFTKANDTSNGSRYVCLSDPRETPKTTAENFQGQYTPKLVRQIPLETPVPDGNLGRVPGTDGGVPNIKHYQDALSRFDTVDIQLLAIPEPKEQALLSAVTRAALDYCENKGDCMFVGHTPEWSARDVIDSFSQNFRSSKVYGALYWPWIKVTDPIGTGANPTKDIPPTGHVLGVYARIDQTRGIWKAPAGNEAVIRGALAVEADITDVDHTDLVKNGSVNGIRKIRGVGIVVDASRTLSTDNRWLYVNVRLLFNYVKASLREELRWVKQEPNREALWNTIKYSTVTPFLQRLYHAGAFGPRLSKDVFTVVCGSENNPIDRIQVGELNVEVYFYPSRPAETIIIFIGQQDSGATASER